MTLAIFDLDNTLLNGDSDHSWGEFLIEHGLVDQETFKKNNDRFYEDYCNGVLDIDAYLRFVLASIKNRSPAELKSLHDQFMLDKIEPMMLPKAQALIESHRERGHTLLVITATNRFITAPIVQRFGIEHLLASDGEQIDGVYTGEPQGIPCFAEGKVARLHEWLAGLPKKENLAGAYFYSDSRNDIPLLERVDNPFAVDPDETLERTARDKGWPVISLR